MVRLLFVFYIFGLAIYPCSDGNTCIDEQKFGFSINATNHAHNGGEQDVCTPFCICACCAATIQLTVSNITVPFFSTHNTRFLIPYKERPWLDNTHSIWQPPKA